MISQAASHSPSSPAPKASVPQRMADFMIRHRAANDGVTREDLLLLFTGEQIDQHLEAAKKLARAAETRQ